MRLDKDKDLKIEHRVNAEAKHEYKQIGSTKYIKGLKLFALNRETLEVYEIPIKTKKVIDLNEKSHSVNRIEINPKHPMIWALNMKNAIRKFSKFENIEL
jgi:hypothetical protein